jgi:hypothetical protein
MASSQNLVNHGGGGRDGRRSRQQRDTVRRSRDRQGFVGGRIRQRGVHVSGGTACGNPIFDMHTEKAVGHWVVQQLKRPA